MMKLVKRSACAVAIAGLLAACSSEQPEGVNLGKLLVGTVKGAAAVRKAGPAQKITVTPAMVANTKVAALQVNPEAFGGSDFLRRVTIRRDSRNGDVEIWQSSDNAHIFLREGVVVGTRGVGSDIIAADASYTQRALKTGKSTSGLRRFTVSDGDVTTTKMQFSCEIRNLGGEKIIIADQSFNTVHMRENCVGGPGGDKVLRNEYWVHMPTGKVRKSRQWVGPRAGYFELILLKS